MEDIDKTNTTDSSVTIFAESAESKDALALMNELSEVLEEITGNSGKGSFHIEDMKDIRSAFAIARSRAGEALGCGAFRPIDDETAEIKRMYVRKKQDGIGAKLLDFLEHLAAQMGYAALRLETRAVNKGAVAFYEACGYYRIPNYGIYFGRNEAVCFEKKLTEEKTHAGTEKAAYRREDAGSEGTAGLKQDDIHITRLDSSYAGEKLVFRYKTDRYYDIVVSTAESGWGINIEEKRFEQTVDKQSDVTLLENWLEKPELYGAVKDGGLIGLVELSHEGWNNRMIISNIFVKDEYRGRGIGCMLMRQAERAAAKAKVRMLVLEVQSCNYPAISLYKKNGFGLLGIDLAAYTNDDIVNHEVRINMCKIINAKHD